MHFYGAVSYYLISVPETPGACSVVTGCTCGKQPTHNGQYIHVSDCVHGTAIADAISELHSGERSWQDIDKELSGSVTPAAVAQLRQDTLELITDRSRRRT